MAENKSREISKMHVTVTADVKESIIGLKALQREIRETIKRLRELEAEKHSDSE